MKNVKWVLSIIIAVFLTWIIFDNKDFLFAERYALQVNLMLEGLLFKTPEWPMALYLLIFAVIGFLTGLMIMIPGKIQDRSQTKKKDQEITKLQKEITETKNRPAPEFALPSQTEEGQTDATAPAAEEAETVQ